MLTVGELLRNERIKRDLSLDVVAKKTSIHIKYLRAIENNEWSAFSSKVYIVGVLKNYGGYLNISGEKLLAYFRRDYEKKEEFHFRRKLPSLAFLPETKILIVGMISSILIIFLIYFSYQFKVYLSPPEVFILSPQKDKFRNVEKVKIKGQTQKESTVRILNDEVYLSQDGIFEYDFPLKIGLNKVTIEVIGPNGKKTELHKDYFLE